MKKISVEEAIDILGQQGFKESDILKMKFDRFIDIVERNIGKVESITFKNKKSLGKQFSTDKPFSLFNISKSIFHPAKAGGEAAKEHLRNKYRLPEADPKDDDIIFKKK